MPIAKLLQPKVAKTTDELLVQMKATPEEAELVKAVDDGPYTEWALKALRKKLVRLPEDTKKVVDSLALFTKLKRSPEFKREHSPNINDYKPADLYALGEESADLTSNKEKIRELIEKGGQGAKLIANSGGFKAFYMTEATPLTILASNTKWCVANEDTAKAYMADGPAFMFYQNDKPFALLHPHSRQFMDPMDNAVWEGVDGHIDDSTNTDTSYYYFMDSRLPYYRLLNLLSDTTEYEELQDRGDFPQILTEDSRDDNVAHMFEAEDIAPLLKYFGMREGAGVEMSKEDIDDLMAVVTNGPTQNLSELFMNVGLHEGPNEVALKLIASCTPQLLGMFQDESGSSDAVSALGYIIDNNQSLVRSAAWGVPTLRAVGATFSAEQIMSHLYRKNLDLDYLSGEYAYLLQGAATTQPEPTAKDLFERFKDETKSPWAWGKWIDAEFRDPEAGIPQAFYDTLAGLIGTAPQKTSSRGLGRTLTVGDIVQAEGK